MKTGFQLLSSTNKLTLVSKINQVKKFIIFLTILILFCGIAKFKTHQRIINLKPPLIYEKGCHISTIDNNWRASDCSFGDIKSPRVIFLAGDSHAAQWFPLLNRIALDKHYKLMVLTRSSCPPLLDVVLSKENKACAEFNRQMIHEIEKLSENSVVIFSALSAQNGYVMSDKSKDYFQQFVSGIVNFSQALPTNRKYYWIEDQPKAQLSINKCNTDFKNHGNICHFRVNFSTNENLILRKIRLLGLEILYTNQIICPNKVCSTVQNNINVWRDQSHLSVPYTAAFDSHLWKIST